MIVVSDSHEYNYLQSRLNFRKAIQNILQLLNVVTQQSCDSHMVTKYNISYTFTYLSLSLQWIWKIILNKDHHTY